jgi:zinc protease
MNQIKFLRCRLALLLLCAALGFTNSFAQANVALPNGVQRVTSVEGITEYRLPNGLRVLLFPDQSKQTITVNVTYLVGSKHENYGETGMAHLLEHLVFKGTPKHTNIPQELNQHGARFNGSTGWDRTNYYETFTATEENLQWALEFEADRMLNSFIAKKDLDSEMTVVRNELEMGENNPGSVLFARVMATSFLWHNYGKLPIGAKADLENVPIDRLQAFYKKHYQPDNAVLLIAGKIDEAKTLALVQQHFAPLPKPTRELPKLYTQDPTQDGERAVTLRRTGDTQFVMAGYHIPAGSHPDAAPISLLAQILGDTPAGRLHKALVETKKASGTFAENLSLPEPGLLFLGAEVRTETSLDAAKDTLLQVIENVAKTPITKEEVERARAQALKQIELNLNSSEQVGVELSEWMAMGDWRMLFLNRDRLRKATVEDVQRVATSYLKPANRTLGLFVPTQKPDRAEIPATPDVLALVKDYKGDALVAAGEAFDPSPSNIESRTTRATTAGGIKTAFLTKKTRGNVVVAQMRLRFGDEKSLLNRATAGSLAGDMLMRGTKTKTRQQIQDQFDQLKARAYVGGSPTGASVSIETTRENLPAVLKLVAEILREPAFPETEFEQLRQEQLAGIEQNRSDPQAIADLAFQQHMAPYPKGHVNYVSTPDEDIAELKAVKLEDLKKFYADFYGANNGEFAAVGDFDEKEVAQLLNTLFGGWKSKMPYARIATTYKDIAAVNKSLPTPDKANAFFVAGLNLNLRDDDPDYPALVLGNYMLGGGAMSSRLATRIRQKDGLSYGVESGLSAGSLDKTGQFVAYAIYAPQNVTKLEAAFKEEIARMLKDGFTAEEIKDAKSGWLQSRQVTRAQDKSLAGKLNGYLFLNRTLAWDAEFDKKVAELTTEQINAALRKFIDPNKISIFKAGDFAKATAGK